MIALTRLDQSLCLVNLDNVKMMDFTPDAVIHFVNGDSLIVRETLAEIEQRVIEYKRKILSLPLQPLSPSSTPNP